MQALEIVKPLEEAGEALLHVLLLGSIVASKHSTTELGGDGLAVETYNIVHQCRHHSLPGVEVLGSRLSHASFEDVGAWLAQIRLKQRGCSHLALQVADVASKR